LAGPRESTRKVLSRRVVRDNLEDLGMPMSLLTDEFPQVILEAADSVLLGRRLLKAYFEAFLEGT